MKWAKVGRFEDMSKTVTHQLCPLGDITTLPSFFALIGPNSDV